MTEPKLSGTSRRGFLKSAGGSAVGAVAIVTLPGVEAGTTQPAWLQEPPAQERELWKQVKKSFSLDPKTLYMNVGTTGSTPTHVLDAHHEYSKKIAQNPLENLGGSLKLRERIASHYGCDTEELVISGNTTDAMCMSLNGLGPNLGSGDAIVTTNHEHPSGTAPMNLLRDRRGVHIVEVDVPVGGKQTVQDYVDLFEAGIKQARKLGKTPKLMVFSAPPYFTGTLLPIRELADLAIREHMYTVVDAAHVSGMFNVSFHDLRVDFMACSGHKWQCGPGGTGIWYVRNQTKSNPLELPRFFPTNSHTYGNDLSETFRDGYFCSAQFAADGGNRYTAEHEPLRLGSVINGHGNPSYPDYAALADVCDFWGAIGYDKIQSYVLGLGRKTKDKVKEIWGEEALYCPCTPGLETALTAFMPGKAFDRTSREASRDFVLKLRERGLVVRNTHVPMPNGEEHNPLRISTHLFHDEDDIDHALATIEELAREV